MTSAFSSNAHHGGSLPSQLVAVWSLPLQADPGGPSPISGKVPPLPQAETRRSQHTTSSYLTERQIRSTKTLSRQAPLPSLLIAMALSRSRLVNSTLVNWLPWSVLKISGLPYWASAASTASRQKSTARVIDTRQDSILRLNQSTTAAR